MKRALPKTHEPPGPAPTRPLAAAFHRGQGKSNSAVEDLAGATVHVQGGAR